MSRGPSATTWHPAERSSTASSRASNGRLSAECLNEALSISLAHVRSARAASHHDYDLIRSRSKLGGRIPAHIAGRSVCGHASDSLPSHQTTIMTGRESASDGQQSRDRVWAFSIEQCLSCPTSLFTGYKSTVEAKSTLQKFTT